MTEEQQIKMFGQTIVEMRSSVLLMNIKDANDLLLYAMSILSDTQELLSRDHTQTTANQWINKAKYFIAEARDIVRAKEWA